MSVRILVKNKNTKLPPINYHFYKNSYINLLLYIYIYIFSGKHLCQSLFFNKEGPATLLKKRLWYRCFPVNFTKFLRTFLQNTSGRLLLIYARHTWIYSACHFHNPFWFLSFSLKVISTSLNNWRWPCL